MAENIITIIFPEYSDSGNSITSTDWITDVLYDDKMLGEQIKEAARLVDFFYDEDCRLYYDSKNVSAFLFAANTLPECYPSRAAQLRSGFKRISDWRKNELLDGRVGDIKTEMASRKKSSPSDSYLIVTDVFSDSSNAFPSKVIDYLSVSINRVFDWLSRHHKPLRVYEWNEKHGENGKGAHPDHKGDKVSVLLCSVAHANELLSKAIGVPMYDFLYNYDCDYGRYMEYKAGCRCVHLPPDATERRYHSYHIGDEQQIPKRVIQKLHILQDLSKVSKDESKRDS